MKNKMEDKMEDNIVPDVPSTEEKEQHYKAIGDSVDLIYAVMSGEAMQDETDEEKKDCVKRNVDHLKIMVAKEWWGSEDMTSANNTIADAAPYIA